LYSEREVKYSMEGGSKGRVEAEGPPSLSLSRSVKRGRRERRREVCLLAVRSGRSTQRQESALE